MKRIISILSFLILFGMSLWANLPHHESNMSNLRHFHQLPNPLEFNQPLKRSNQFSNFINGKNPGVENGYSSKAFTTSLPHSESYLVRNVNTAKNINTASTAYKTSDQDKVPRTMYNVESEMVFDPTIYNPGSIVFYNSEFNEEFHLDYDEQTNQVIPLLNIELPAGEYVADALFYIAYSDEGIKAKDGACALVIKENIKIPGDEKIIFDAGEATNQIRFRAQLPDGQNATLPLYDLDEWKELKPGTIKNIELRTYIIDREIGPIDTYYTNQDFTEKESDEINDFDIYVNDLSDRFCAYNFYMMNTSETSVLGTQYIGQLYHEKTQTLTSADSYRKITTEFEHTPLYNEIGLAKDGFHMRISLAWATEKEGLMTNDLATDKNYIYYSQDKHCNQETLLPLISVQPYDASYYITEEYPWGETESVLIHELISALPFAILDDELQYVNNNHSACGNFSFQLTEDNKIFEYPGHTKYSFFPNEQTSLLGNNAPINAVMNQINPYYQDPSRFMNSIQSAFIGRWGEVRNVDNSVTSTIITFNGQEVFNSNEENADLDLWGYKWGQVEEQKGEFNYYINNQNIAVDGICGRNYTHIYSDWRKEDKNAPVLQMLMFRNSLDEITDRFDNAVDGIIEFSGGDFNWHYLTEPDRTYFSCQPMEVRVEYSPYNQESWSEVEVMELPEYYFMPGFGYFYRGSLACVDKMSENGWYDLKFTMTDEVGNYMEQTVSPAFKITALTGKAEISTYGVQVYACNGMIHISAEDLATAEVYSMDGRLNYNGNSSNIPMSHGAYIVKVSTRGGAESIHKVIL